VFVHVPAWGTHTRTQDVVDGCAGIKSAGLHSHAEHGNEKMQERGYANIISF